MTPQEMQSIAYTLANVAAVNQPNYVFNELARRGIISSQFTPSGDVLANKLTGLYVTDKRAFYDILEGVQYDPSKTDSSTSPDTINTLSSIATSLGISRANSTARFNFKDIWDEIVGAIGGTDTVVAPTTTTTTTSTNTAAIIGLVFVAGLAVVITYFAFFRKSS